MSPNPSQNPPSPEITAPPFVVGSSHRRSKRRRQRQVAEWPEVEDAKRKCQILSGNDIFSCFPTTETVVPQHQWAAFVWNSRVPQITQTNRVNIYLFHGDSFKQILSFKNQINPQGDAGLISARVNDTWFGDRGREWNGKNVSYPFYWVITRADKELDGTERPQAVFHAVQTTYADSVAASMTSASLAASSRSISAVGGTSTNSVQSGATSSGFPHWAIGVISALGFLAVATSCILAFVIIRRIRRREERDSNRNSVGSSSPMMANIGNSPGSPLLAHVPDRHSSVGHHAPSVVSPDGASTISRVGSVTEGGPFSGADAAIMADAFRKALRKPDFADRPVEEGESPEQPEGVAEQKEELLNRELAEEGRDLRSVSSSKGFKVESVSSSGDATHDHR